MFPEKKRVCDKKYILPTVVKRKHRIQRYVECQHEFISYAQIANYLDDLKQKNPDIFQLEIIGESKQGRNIYLVGLTKNLPYPTLSTIIEAGSNGSELYTVSTALYFIDYMVKTPNSLVLMDYYIIPCLNPDAYELAQCDYNEGFKRTKRRKKRNCLQSDQKSDQKLDLTNEFPRIDVVYRPCLMVKPYAPEIIALYRVLDRYKTITRMFISLREGGRSILYPWGYSESPTSDQEDLKKIATSGLNAVKSNPMTIGSIAERRSISKGNVVDYIKFFHNTIKFVYSLHISDDTSRDKSNIISRGLETCEIIKTMASSMYKFLCKISCNLVTNKAVYDLRSHYE